MTKKIKNEIKLGAAVRLKAQSGEIIEGRVVHLWEEKSVQMVRKPSRPLVYNVPASKLVDKTEIEMIFDGPILYRLTVVKCSAWLQTNTK